MPEEMPKTVFMVHYGCTNCGAEFTLNYPETCIVESNLLRGCRSRKGEGYAAINLTYCPVCKRYEYVIIKKREPIYGDKLDYRQRTKQSTSVKHPIIFPNCHDCGARPGEPHKDGCDTEVCSVCGNQRLCCECKGHDKGFARWTGIYPGKAESEFIGVDLNEFALYGYSKLFFIKPKNKDNGG